MLMGIYMILLILVNSVNIVIYMYITNISMYYGQNMVLNIDSQILIKLIIIIVLMYIPIKIIILFMIICILLIPSIFGINILLLSSTLIIFNNRHYVVILLYHFIKIIIFSYGFIFIVVLSLPSAITFLPKILFIYRNILIFIILPLIIVGLIVYYMYPVYVIYFFISIYL